MAMTTALASAMFYFNHRALFYMQTRLWGPVSAVSSIAPSATKALLFSGQRKQSAEHEGPKFSRYVPTRSSHSSEGQFNDWRYRNG